jgi:hypothetical protein
MYWSRINTERDRSRPRPLNSAIVANESMLAIDVADARGNSLAGSGHILLEMVGGLSLKVCARFELDHGSFINFRFRTDIDARC